MFLVKPLSPTVLLEAVEKQLSLTSEPAAIRPILILAEDDDAARERLARLLASDYVVVSVRDGAAVLAQAEQIRPAVVLLDIGMPGMNGFTVARMLRRSMPNVPILFVTQHAEPVYVGEAFASGGAGYVLKGRAAAELRPALREVRTGGRYISPGLRSA